MTFMKNSFISLILTVPLLIFMGCASTNQECIIKQQADNRKSSNFSAKSTVIPMEKEVKSEKPLEGLSICIDAGHGNTTRAKAQKEPIAPGSDILKAAFASGTTGVSTKISEESLNLAVSQKLKKALGHEGAAIIMIRETGNCDLSNVERAKLWNKSGADFTIRIHANGASDSKASGILMMVPANKYIKDRNMLDTSTRLGQCILDGVIKYTKAKSKGLEKTSELTGFNWSTIPVVLIEMGFMTNPQEDKLLNTDDYQNKIVSGIVVGIKNYRDTFTD